MSNHFHFLVRIKAKNEINVMQPNYKNSQVSYTLKKKYDPAKQFLHLFNAYVKAYNKRYSRTGGLFETLFKRVQVNNDNIFETSSILYM